jgi:hypothetical protein
LRPQHVKHWAIHAEDPEMCGTSMIREDQKLYERSHSHRYCKGRVGRRTVMSAVQAALVVGQQQCIMTTATTFNLVSSVMTQPKLPPAQQKVSMYRSVGNEGRLGDGPGLCQRQKGLQIKSSKRGSDLAPSAVSI